VEVHKFNDDLLLLSTDRDRAKAAYPAVFFALDDEALRRDFVQYDVPANQAKRRARRSGLVSVILTAAALCGASTGTLFHHVSYGWAFGTGFAVLGVVGVLIAFFGLLYGAPKRRWLEHRLMTERLRQFHFQTMLSNLDLFGSLSANGDSQDLYRQRRARSYSAFLQRFDSHLQAEFESIASDEQSSDIWLQKRPEEVPVEVLNMLPEDLFAAYRDLRLRHQLNYASWKLQNSGSVFDGSLRGMRTLLSFVSIGAVILLFGVDLAAATVTPWQLAWFPEVELHIVALCLAVIALAARAVEEGTQVRIEIDRYRNYRNTLRALLTRFETTASRRDKVQVMIDMERLVFLEMKAFLMANHESTFVM
jgi:MFS family permease